MRSSPPPGAPRFLNVDLEIWSRADLSALAAALEPRAVVLHAGKIRRKYLVSIEERSGRAPTPAATIRALLRVIAALPPAARRLWKSADARIFNLGFEGGQPLALHERPPGSGRWYARDPEAPVRYEASLGPELLRAVARAGGTLTTTIYAPVILEGGADALGDPRR